MAGRVRSTLRRVIDHLSALTPSLTVPEAVGLGIVAAAFVFFGGAGGALAAAAVVGFWLAFPVEYAFAAGQIGLVAVAPDQVGLPLLVTGEAGLGLVVAGSLRKAGSTSAQAVGWLLAAAGLGFGILIAVTAEIALWQTAVVLLAVCTATAYGLHRHELVRLGLATGERNQ